VVPEDFRSPADPRLRVLAWVVAVMLVLGFGSCISEGADIPADPRLPQAREFPGFGEVAFRIEPAPNQLRCALLASTEEQRARGLMEVRDLKGYAGMVFRFASDSQAGFHMRNTPMGLSIAWFAADGTFVSAQDMAPCDADAPDCPVYSASAPFRYALEVPFGQLPALGVGQGSKLVLEATHCPAT
jgi:uncharacterized membrane protein (UPF0127 family)